MRPGGYTSLLEARWCCRETEGGCGAKAGEKCKTWAEGKPTVPHADRWRQQEVSDYQETMRRNPPPAIAAERLARVEAALAAYLEPWNIPAGDLHNAAVIAVREAQS